MTLWSLTTVRLLGGQAAADKLWKLPIHFEIHNAEEVRQPGPAGREDTAGGKGTGWGRLGGSELLGREKGATAEGLQPAEKRAKSRDRPPATTRSDSAR